MTAAQEKAGVLAVLDREVKSASRAIDVASGKPYGDLNRLSKAQADAVVRRREEAEWRLQKRYKDALGARATVAEYERVLSIIANKDGDFHDDNDALDRFADLARAALAQGKRP